MFLFVIIYIFLSVLADTSAVGFGIFCRFYPTKNSLSVISDTISVGFRVFSVGKFIS